jgi:hypothetical protein
MLVGEEIDALLRLDLPDHVSFVGIE